MTWGDGIVIGIIVLIIAGAVIKIVRDKKKGKKCTGCEGCSGECPYK